MPKNHGRIVSIFSSHKDRCPSFYHSDLHAKFQPIPTGAIREIAPLGDGGKSQLSVTKPAGPLPRRLYETIWRCHARPPRGQAVPQGQEFPPVTRTPCLSLCSVNLCLCDYLLLPTHHNDRQHTLTQMSCRGLELQHAANQKIFRNDVCQFEPFRLGVGRISSMDGSLSIDYERNCLAGDKPLRQFLLGLTSRK